MRLIPFLAAPAAALLLASCAASEPADESTPGLALPEITFEPAEPLPDDEAAGDDAATSGAAGSEAEAAEGDAAEGDGAAPAGDERFSFTVQTVADEGDFDGAALAGTDVVLWFWAPWCPTCQLQSSTIAEALPNMPEDVPLIGVAGLSDDLGYMQEFVDANGVDGMVHLADLDGGVFERFGVTQQSTLMFIDDAGGSSLLGAGASAGEIVAEAEELAVT